MQRKDESDVECEVMKFTIEFTSAYAFFIIMNYVCS